MPIQFETSDEELLQQAHKEFYSSGEYLDYFPSDY